MAARLNRVSCVLLLLLAIQACSALRWVTSATLTDGGTVKACVGQDLTLNWTYALDPSEHIDDVQWFYRTSGGSDQLQAILVNDAILPIPGAQIQMTFISNAGVQVHNVTLQDSGTYSVHVTVNLRGSIKIETQTVHVQAGGPQECLSVEERLQQCQATKTDLESRLTPLTATQRQNAATLETLKRQLATCENRDHSPAPTSPPPTYPPWFRPTNCRDVRVFDSTTGVYTVFLRNDTPIPVFCDQDSQDGGWMVIQRRTDGTENFYRPIAEYENGFGDLRGEFWLGLKAMSDVTKYQQHSLRIDLEDFEGRRVYAEYSSFRVESSSALYRIYVSGYSGTAGDGLHVDNGNSFSTFDSDHDSWSQGNCAETMHGAWWYENCGPVNLNGQYKPQEGFGMDNIIWEGAYGSKPIKKTEMKIKPTPTTG